MRKNRLLALLLSIIMVYAMMVMTACSNKEKTNESGLSDGTYVATFTTDNSMFHVNEANEDKGILTVKDGDMTIHVSLQSKKILNLFPGTAEDAAKDGAALLEPTTDTITYSDGYEEEVYGFDVPVPALDEEFDLALIGTKGVWYDHKVVVSDPVEGDDIRAVLNESGSESEEAKESGSPADAAADGEHTAEVVLSGGTGKASVESPTEIRKDGDKWTAVIKWSSPHYDYMLVDGQKYEPVNSDGNSVFEIPILFFDKEMPVVADTTAMSEPHEIEYTLRFDSSSIK